MKKFTSGEIAKIGVLSALTTISIWILRIPGPGGKVYFHLGETLIIVSAVLLGKRGGALVGAISSALADLLLGAAVWAPFSFIIHSFQGYLIGDLADNGKRDLLASIAGVTVMALGYTAVAGWLYGPAIMPVELIGDAAQGGIGVLMSQLFLRVLLHRFPQLRQSA